jgi:hemerythrin-like domain-containing protein
VLTDQQRYKHEYFMAIRDKYIAHSVNAFEESQPVARYWVERVQEEGITSIECNHRRIAGLSEQEFQDIIDLASTWLKYVQQQLREEKNRLLPIVQKIPLQDLFQSAPKFTPAPDTSQPQKRRSRL